jgi:hypothetical protein
MSENLQIIKSPDDEGVVYLKFGASTEKAIKQLRLHDFIEYSGADVYLDIMKRVSLLESKY